jgi:hypothetical protein
MSPAERGGDEATGSKPLRERMPGWFRRVDLRSPWLFLLVICSVGGLVGLSMDYRPPWIGDGEFFVVRWAVWTVWLLAINRLWWRWRRRFPPPPFLWTFFFVGGSLGYAYVYTPLSIAGSEFFVVLTAVSVVSLLAGNHLWSRWLRR